MQRNRRDTVKELLQLRSQIIDDQQITIKNMMMDLRYILGPVKNILFKYIK